MTDLLLAQDLGPIAGPAGWVGAGLLGLVLGWLFFVHLPAKDKQLDAKDKAFAEAMEKKDLKIQTMAEAHAGAVERVVKSCREEGKADREMWERANREQTAWLQKLHDSTREAVHATRDLANAYRMRSRLADVVQSAEAPVWTESLDGTLMSWNAAGERLLGWSQGEVVGKSVYLRIVPPDRRDEEESALRLIHAGETVPEYETERLHRDGRRLRLLVLISPIRDQSGRVVGASTIAREP